MKISEHFLLEEFVPKEIFEKWGERAIWFVDPRLIKLAEFVREFFGGKAVTINNWHSGGSFNYRGFRNPECSVGAKMSQHRFGRAMDINIAGLTPQAINEQILANKQVFMEAGLTTLEDISMTPTWNHLDIRQTDGKSIKIVKP